MINTTAIGSNSTLQRSSSESRDSGLLHKALNTLYRWQDKGKAPLGHSNPSFKDLGVTRGDGRTDYAKPVWRR